ncbi:hypothetical protein D3C86_2240410 [compost metagenome]
MAATDQQQLALARLGLRGEARQVGNQQRRRGLNGLGFGFQAPGQVRLQRP